MAARPFDPFHEARIDARPGAQVPLDLVFTDQNGSGTTLRRIAGGKPVLLVPVLHECPNICGVTLRGLASAIAKQPYKAGEDFEVIAFGIDPKETAADAAADSDRQPKLDATFLVGSDMAVHAVTDALGYRYAYDPRIRQYAHIAAIAVLAPGGKLVRWVNGIAPDPRDLGRAITDAGDRRTNVFAQAVAVLCYHYDPRTGQYSLAINRIVQAASILTVLILGAVVLGLWRRRA